MILSIKEDNLTVSIEFPEIDEVKPSAADVLIGAYDVNSRIFSQEAVIGAYYSTDPDTMDFRRKDDDFLKHVKFFGYDDRKEDRKQPLNISEQSENYQRKKPRIVTTLGLSSFL